jgi:excisionase family DNA binding protein
MTNPTLPEICTPQEVAAYLKTTASHIMGLARKGKLPAFQVGSRWRFKADDILNYVKDSTSCQEKAQGQGWNGARNEMSMRSSGTSGEIAAAKARAQMMLERLKSSSNPFLLQSQPTTGQVIPINAS